MRWLIDCFFVGALFFGGSVMADTLRPSTLLPDCHLKQVSDGKLVSLAKVQKGKKTVVHVFASW